MIHLEKVTCRSCRGPGKASPSRTCRIPRKLQLVHNFKLLPVSGNFLSFHRGEGGRGLAGTWLPHAPSITTPRIKQFCWSPPCLCFQAKLPLKESFQRKINGKSPTAVSSSWRADVSAYGAERGGLRAVRMGQACPPHPDLPVTPPLPQEPRHLSRAWVPACAAGAGHRTGPGWEGTGGPR